MLVRIMMNFYGKKKLAKAADRICAVNFDENKFSLICLRNNAQKEILYHQTISFTDERQLKRKLRQVVKKKQLVNLPCTWVLNSNDYKLLLIDLPKVKEQEMSKALHWYINSNYDFIAKDALIDWLPLPSTDGIPNKAYLVASDQKKILAKSTIIEASGLHLKTIDIVESCLRNLVTKLKISREEVVLLTIISGQILLLICKNGYVYLARRLLLELADKPKQEVHQEESKEQPEITASDLKIADSITTPLESKPLQQNIIEATSGQEISFNQLVDEINRSLDYATNIFSIKMPEIILLSEQKELHGLKENLAQAFSQKILSFDIGQVFANSGDIQDLDDQLPLLGALMRDDSK